MTRDRIPFESALELLLAAYLSPSEHTQEDNETNMNAAEDLQDCYRLGYARILCRGAPSVGHVVLTSENTQENDTHEQRGQTYIINSCFVEPSPQKLYFLFLAAMMGTNTHILSRLFAKHFDTTVHTISV